MKNYPYNPIMPTNRTLSLLALAAVLPLAARAQDPAQAPATPPAPPATPAAPPPPTEASHAVDEAIDKVKAIESVAADIQMDAQMLGQHFRLVGQYLKAPGNRMLIRLSVEDLGDVSGLMQQVSDGDVLWDYSQILEGRSLRKLRLEPVLQIVNRPDADPEIREMFLTQIGLGGAEALMRGLRKAVAFDQKRSEALDGRAVWVLGGSWTDTAALGLPGAQPVNTAGLPPVLPAYVPSRVELWVGQEDGWPYRVVFQGSVPSSLRDTRITGPDGQPYARKPTGSRSEKPTSLTLLYTRLEREVKPTDFLFQPPPGIEALDDTDRFVAGLEAQMAEAAARKKAEGAGESGDLLDQPLTAPRPESGTPAPAPGAAPPAETFRSSAPPR